ncbi:MAG: creatinine amidohydrolase [Paracoccaceae bacterium]|jgi:creatinine amidohydrolase
MSYPTAFWRDMSTRIFSRETTSDWIAVLPIAAIEQHGPHLPVGVDAVIAEEMVKRCVQARPDSSKTVFLPLQEICKSNEHIAFPGTLTLDWDVAVRAWIQIGQSVARAGVKKLVIITSHGGNVPPMEIAARELRQTNGMAVVTTSWGRLGRGSQIYDRGEGPMVDIHGGLGETSLMLALRPDLVDMTYAEDFQSSQTALRQGSVKLGYHMADANMAWLSHDLNPKGTVGNASAGSADLGAQDVFSQVEGFWSLMSDLERVTAPDDSYS